MALEAIRYTRGHLQILDQLRLPHLTTYETIRSSQDAWNAIKTMQVRGAPAIAIVAALAVAVELEGFRSDDKVSRDANDIYLFILENLDHLLTSRPTAVNLADAVAKLKKTVFDVVQKPDVRGDDVIDAYIQAAEQMLVDDVKDNESIGRHGANWIMKHTSPDRDDGAVSVLTHCNTGSLATAGYGTALGVIRALHGSSFLRRAFCTETRPYNQGSRLTAYELVHDKIPATLITDSMAASLLRVKGSNENLTTIVVGADRVAANGDTANKIGTYQLAVLARQHGVKFLVAAPRTTIDLNTPSGDDIVIEERPGREVAQATGPLCREGGLVGSEVETVVVAAQGIEMWNPAFDVTPAELIDAIITEVGAVEKGPDGRFSLQGIFGTDASRIKV